MKRSGDANATLGGLTKAAAALGDPGRMRLFCYIDRGERCVCDLVDLVGLAPATVSRHLTLMREAGLIVRMKSGRWHHYRVAEEGPAVAFARLAAEMLRNDPVVAKDARRVPKRLGDGEDCAGGCAGKK